MPRRLPASTFSAWRRSTLRRGPVLALAECCRADTPLGSLSNVSRSRQTTDRHSRFVSQVADADSSRSATLAPAHFPTPPPCAWARGYFDELTGPVAEGGTGRRNKTPIPQLGGIREGNRGCVRMSSPRRTARGRNYARPIRHSVGRSVALNGNYLP